MKLKPVLLWTAAASLAFAGVAHAAAGPAPAMQPIPWGAWAANALLASEGLLATVVSGLVVKYVPAIYRVFLTPRVIEQAVDYAVATTAGALKGQTLSVTAASAVLAQAEAYLLEHEPDAAKWLGATLRPRIVAFLSAQKLVPAEADAASLQVAPSA